MSDSNDDAPKPVAPEGAADEAQVGKGLMYVLDALGTNIVNIRQVAAHVFALSELLIAKGVVTLPEIEKRRESLTTELVEDALQDWDGARMNTDATDKYKAPQAVEIDCASRVHLCKSACCKFAFYLSGQDLEEGVIRWSFGKPYLIRQADDGYCVHSDPATRACTVHEKRPLPCREYDCRDDERIWLDFANMIPNPDLDKT